MKISAVSTNAQNFSGVRKVFQKGAIDCIGDFLVKPVREVTTKDGIAGVTRFFTQKGKEIGYHAVGKNGNMIGQRTFSNGTKIQYWTDIMPSGNKKLSVWVETKKATNKTPAEYVVGFLPADTITKNPKLITTKKGLFDLLKAENARLETLAKKLFKDAEKRGLVKDVSREVL